MTERRLLRRTDNRMIAGVAAGLADFLGIDPTIVRLVFVVLALLGGGGLLLYLVMWIIVPKPEQITAAPRDVVKGNVDDLVREARRAASGLYDAVRGDRSRDSTAQPPPSTEPDDTL